VSPLLLLLLRQRLMPLERGSAEVITARAEVFFVWRQPETSELGGLE
jgi:hypothetical protein